MNKKHLLISYLTWMVLMFNIINFCRYTWRLKSKIVKCELSFSALHKLKLLFHYIYCYMIKCSKSKNMNNCFILFYLSDLWSRNGLKVIFSRSVIGQLSSLPDSHWSKIFYSLNPVDLTDHEKLNICKCWSSSFSLYCCKIIAQELISISSL